MSKKRNDELSTTNWIVKSNKLNEIRNNKMTISQIRFFSIYLSKINPQNTNSREVTFNLEEYTKIMQFKQTNTTRLMATAEDLLGLTVSFRDTDGGFTMCQIFKRFKLYKDDMGEWCVTIDCHDDILKYVFELRGYYFKYQLWNALQLTSNNQQRMYEVLKQYEYVGAREISLKDLREFIGLKDSEYPRWDNFKTRILDGAQQALANYTDIQFTWEVSGKRGKGGKINYLKFNISKNDCYTRQLTLNDYLTEQNKTEFEDEPTEFEYENENLGFLADACNKSFTESQMKEIFHLVSKAVPYFTNKQDTALLRYNYLLEKYTYSKNRSSGNLFNYLKTVLQKSLETE